MSRTKRAVKVCSCRMCRLSRTPPMVAVRIVEAERVTRELRLNPPFLSPRAAQLYAAQARGER